MKAPRDPAARALAGDHAALPINWWPMIFSVLLLDHFNDLLGRGNASERDWVFTGLGVVAGVALFAAAVMSWQRRRSLLWVVAIFMTLWVVFDFCGLPAHWFIDFAAIFIPWAVRGSLWRSAWIMALLLALAAVYVYFDSPVRGYTLLIGFIANTFILVFVAGWQVWLARMVLGLRRLAQAAERERISRELHDLLGNALSEITARSVRACDLLRQSPLSSDAGVEIAAVETVCRQALADVRKTLRDYRTEEQSDPNRGRTLHSAASA
jgi:signal transduction histidine kinase